MLERGREFIFEGEDRSLVGQYLDGIRVISNTRRILEHNITGVLGRFEDLSVENQMRRRRGGILEEGDAQGGMGAVIFPVPIRVQGENGEPNLLYPVSGLEIGGVNLDCIVCEDEGNQSFRSESTERREEEEEENGGGEDASAQPNSAQH